VFAGSVDLQGNAAIYDDPEGSLRWLPYLGFCEADDPIWTDTMDLFYSKGYPLWRGGAVAEGLTGRDTGGAASFAALCAEALTPRRPRAIETLASLALPGGIACRTYDPDTAACATGPWSASHAGLFAWTLLDEQRRKEPAPRKR
jgi:meiotically up-regulated gene 157 (Mug157) protein